jgi:anti-sigma B factor antagonist
MTPHDIGLGSRQALLCVRSQRGYTVAAITGELGGASVPALREQLRGLPDRQASRIIVDLSGVTSCDASGLATLVASGHRAWRLGGILQLTVPSPAALSALRLTGLDAYFEIVAPGVPQAENHDSERAGCVRPGHAVSPEPRTVR